MIHIVEAKDQSPRVELVIEPDAERTRDFLRDWIAAARARKAAREKALESEVPAA